MAEKNTLYYGDNLTILRERIAPESVDLVYLDPPFNSNRSYNILFGQHGPEAQAQIEAFGDTWTWSQESERLYFDLINGGAPSKVADAIQAMHGLLGENDVLAYLVMMAARLVALHRVMKPTASIYLHCDPTASHYLKIVMDAVFGAVNFKNEVIWKRASAHNDATRHGQIHDVLLFYTKGSTYTWNPQYTPYSEEYLDAEWRELPSGRFYKCENMLDPRNTMKEYDFMGTKARWRTNYEGMMALWNAPQTEVPNSHGRIKLGRNGKPIKRCRIIFLDELPGVPLQSIWTDIVSLRGGASERLGYPTQKPLALLRRIIESSSNPGDVVLDPFCGCGTTIIAAQELGRSWIGIDITYIAIDLMRRRLEDAFGSEVEFEIDGIPKDLASARALFDRSPFDFERWAVSLVYGQPNEKQVGDRGADGVVRFPMPEKKKVGRVLVSVKGGERVGPNVVRDLDGTVHAEKAEMGVLITMAKPTAKTIEAANHTGSYVWPVDGQAYARIQITTIEDLLGGKRLKIPSPLTPYLQAPRYAPKSDQLALGWVVGPAPIDEVG